MKQIFAAFLYRVKGSVSLVYLNRTTEKCPTVMTQADSTHALM